MALFEKRVHVGIIGSDIEGFVNDLELVSTFVRDTHLSIVIHLQVEMERVESAVVSARRHLNAEDLRIPIENGQLHSRHMGVGKRVCLRAIHLRIERVITHGHSRKDSRCVRHLVSDVVDCSSASYHSD